MGALLVLSLKDNGLGTKEAGKALGEMLKANSVLKELDLSSNHVHPDYGGDAPGFAQELAIGIKDNEALFSLNLSRNYIGADGVASLTAALKRHAIEHQRPCISICLGDQDQHARTKDLRALLVATSNLNPSHCMPAISDDLLKGIAEWL
jgi:hypothetical protein